MNDGLPQWYDHWRIGDPGRTLGRHEHECSDCEGTGTAEDGLARCTVCDGDGIVQGEPNLD